MLLVSTVNFEQVNAGRDTSSVSINETQVTKNLLKVENRDSSKKKGLAVSVYSNTCPITECSQLIWLCKIQNKFCITKNETLFRYFSRNIFHTSLDWILITESLFIVLIKTQMQKFTDLLLVSLRTGIWISGNLFALSKIGNILLGTLCFSYSIPTNK